MSQPFPSFLPAGDVPPETQPRGDRHCLPPPPPPAPPGQSLFGSGDDGGWKRSGGWKSGATALTNLLEPSLDHVTAIETALAGPVDFPDDEELRDVLQGVLTAARKVLQSRLHRLLRLVQSHGLLMTPLQWEEVRVTLLCYSGTTPPESTGPPSEVLGIPLSDSGEPWLCVTEPELAEILDRRGPQLLEYVLSLLLVRLENEESYASAEAFVTAVKRGYLVVLRAGQRANSAAIRFGQSARDRMFPPAGMGSPPSSGSVSTDPSGVRGRLNAALVVLERIRHFLVCEDQATDATFDITLRLENRVAIAHHRRRLSEIWTTVATSAVESHVSPNSSSARVSEVLRKANQLGLLNPPPPEALEPEQSTGWLCRHFADLADDDAWYESTEMFDRWLWLPVLGLIHLLEEPASGEQSSIEPSA